MTPLDWTLVSTYTLHTKMKTHPCVCSAQFGRENRTCLQCLKFPNRPLNYFRDAIFKAYNNSWILMLPEIYIYIFDCIFNETFWATFCKEKKTSKKKRLRKAAWLWSARQGSGALLWNESGTSTGSPASSILSLRLQLIWMYLSRPVCFKLFSSIKAVLKEDICVWSVIFVSQ